MKHVFVTGVASIACAGAVASAGVVNNAEFNSDLEGFGTSTSSEFTWQAAAESGFGGYVEFNDTSSISGFLYAPEAWLGDLSAFDGNSTFSFDHRVIAASSGTSRIPYELIIRGAGGTARWTSAAIATNDWVTHDIEFEAESFDVSGATWAEILSDVSSIELRVEIVANGSGQTDIEAIDNIRFMSSTIPAPASLFAFAALARRRRRA